MENNYDHIKSIAEDYKPTPPPMAWNRIEQRLSDVKSKSKRNRLNFIKFWFTIAASLMVILTCTYIIYQESISPQTYGVEYVAELEDLSPEVDYLYSLENVRKIYNATKN
ncbi:hypothetical protein N9L92_00035 [Saprospiraceae bacterium]|nr:hypothetical protein [Saprospiraceae bacterium]